jgi:hypothetical protein
LPAGDRDVSRQFDEGSFDPSPLIKTGSTLANIAPARGDTREQAQIAGRRWDDGAFDPEDMPDVIIDKRPNIDPFMDDPESYRLRAIEHYDDVSGKAEKAAVFRENVISRPLEPDIKSVRRGAARPQSEGTARHSGSWRLCR